MKKRILFLFISLVIILSNVYCQRMPKQLYTIGDNVNIRNNATTSGAVVKKVPKFSEFEVLEVGAKETINGNSDYWYKVKSANCMGWVFGHFTSLKQAGRKEIIATLKGYNFADYGGYYTFIDQNGLTYTFDIIPTDIPLGGNESSDVNPIYLIKKFKLMINKIPWQWEDYDGVKFEEEVWVCYEFSEIK